MNPVTTTNSGTVIPHKFNKLPKDRSENNGTGVPYNLLQKQIQQIATAGGTIDTPLPENNEDTVESNPETLPRKKKKTTTSTAKQQSSVTAATTTDEEGPTVDEDDKAAMHLLLHFKDANSKDGSSINNSSGKKRTEENNTTQMMANHLSSSTSLFSSMNPLQAQQALFPLNFQQYLANSNVFNMSAAAAAAAAANPHLANLSMLNFPNAFPALTPTANSASLKRKYDEADLAAITAANVTTANGGLTGASSNYLAGNYQLHKDGSSVSATNFGANTSTTTSTTKKEEVNILQFYEPRFFTVYEQYQQYLAENSLAATYSISTNIRDHLLSLCLDHMISFCCWARENPTTTTWIKTTLDDNNDLRPEVRNGLSMILMYCFSAAQSKLRKDSDMFITLQDTETGLGIVNKTSLKIYNDPYQYFNFIKSCITGLIDAGKIPENERINKPKKSKPQAESKEEIEAFNEMRKIIVDKLSKHEADFIREKVSQISNVWYRRQVVRSKRFVTALAIMMTPLDFLPRTLLTVNPSSMQPNSLDHQMALPNPNELSAGDLSRIIASQQYGRTQRGTSIMSVNDDPSEEDEGMKRVPSQATIHRASENPFIPPQLRASVSLEGVKSPYYSATTPAILRRESDQQSFQSTSMDYDDDNDDNSQERLKAGVPLAPINVTAVYAGNSGNTPKKASQLTVPHPLERDLSTAFVPSSVSSVLPQALPKSPSPTSSASVIINTQKINPVNSSQQRLPTPTNANTIEEGINSDSSTILIDQSFSNSLPYSVRMQLPALFGQRSSQASLHSVLPNAIIHSAREGTIVYRFDRISNREWKTREMKIFNFEQLLLKKSQNNITNFYLIDEKKLFKSLEERQKQHITTSLTLNGRNNSGSMMMSLINELHERNALITSWGKNDIIHLLDLVDSWLRGGKNIPLLDFWSLRHAKNEVAVDNLKMKENDKERGKGVICYEIMMQIGFVIRKNEDIGLHEDCWRMMYFTDLLASNNNASSTSFLDLLITFFPQLSCLVSNGKKRKVVLKYYAHPLFSSSSSEDDVASPESDLLSPPTVLEKKECYQTIGLITETSENIFARFSYDYVFHDLILQVID